jgi:type VI secretion system secreted protein VgrG
MIDPNLIPGNRIASVGANETITIAGNRTVSVGGNDVTSIVGVQQATVGKKFLLEAADEIDLRVGSARLLMRKDGTIVLSGHNITIQATSKINIKSSGDVIIKGSKVVQN